MKILYFISLIVFLTYILLVIQKYGVPKSISESSYLIGKNGDVVFYSVFAAFILPLLIYWLSITQGQGHQFLVFLSCASLCFTGITGRFKPDGGSMQQKIHLIATVIAAILSQLWMWITFPMTIYTIVLFIPIYFLGKAVPGAERGIMKFQGRTLYSEIAKSNSSLFWVEILLFAMAYSSIFIYGML